MKRFAIIVAGGTGVRMGGNEPKQFLLLKGRPLLMHSIEKFEKHCDAVHVVLNADWISHWKKLCREHHFTISHHVIEGGEKRADSVKAGLDALNGDGIVGVHDAARPLISEALIEAAFANAEKSGNAVPVIPAGDSIRVLDDKSNKSVDRNNYVLVQTPQCFRITELKKAFNSLQFSNYTDEASLMENAGFEIYLIDGERSNIKITHPNDLIYAQTCVL